MRLYSEEQVRQAIHIDDVIRVIREAFAHGFATVHMPARTLLNMDDAILLVMPCYDSDLHAAGVLTDEEFAAKKAQILGL